jgi:adenylylsulfate kinase
MDGVVLWFTGLSGAGKSTIARLVEAELRQRGERVEVLDGDEVREHLSHGLGFAREDRDTNVRRIGWVAKLLARNGVVAITAAISPFRATRAEVRATMPDRFVEVYVKTPLEECVRRDVKGLYARALRGEIPHFTGVSDPYEAPETPELVIETVGETPTAGAERVIAYVEEHGWIRPVAVRSGDGEG